MATPRTPQSKRPRDEDLTHTQRKEARPAVDLNGDKASSDDDDTYATTSLEFRYLTDGSVVITTPDAMKIVMTLTGKPLLHERQQIVYEGSLDDVVKDPLNVFNLRKFHCLGVGNTEDWVYQPVINFSTASGLGYINVKDLVVDVIEPAWQQFGIHIEHHGQPVAANATLKVRYNNVTGGLTLIGTPPEDTFKVNPNIVNLKKHGLVWNKPFWVNKNSDERYDPTTLMRDLSSKEFISLPGAENIPGYER
jgi:hypothetical protein